MLNNPEATGIHHRVHSVLGRFDVQLRLEAAGAEDSYRFAVRAKCRHAHSVRRNFALDIVKSLINSPEGDLYTKSRFRNLAFVGNITIGVRYRGISRDP